MSTFYIPLVSYQTITIVPDVKNKRRPFPQYLNTPSINVTGTFLGQANFAGAGTGGNLLTCPIDSILQKFNNPRTTPAVVMPIAYITKVNNFTTAPNCSPTTTTIPATGSFATLVEGSTQPQNMP